MSTLQQALSSLLFVLVLAHARTAATTSTLEDTCKRFAGGDQAGHDYDYCLKTLRANPATAGADAPRLAAFAANIARSAAKATSARIGQLQAAETVPARRDCLAKCATEYHATVRRLSRAGRDAFIGDGDELREAQTLLAEALGAPLRCDRAFTDAGQKSPLSTADHERAGG
ncbi:hypothetical protein ACQ4PT_033420 [Festuca glaucescens]